MSSTARPAKPATSGQRQLGLAYTLAACVLVGSLLLVLLSWRNAQQRALRGAERAFRQENAQVQEALRQRLVNYELLLRSGAMLQAALARPSPMQWRTYVDGLRVEERFPSMDAFGFAARVDDTARLRALRSALSAQAYAAAPVSVTQAGSHALVLYLEPQAGDGRELMNTDLSVQPLQRAALQEAATTSNMRMTPPIATQGRAPSLLLFAPVYPPGMRHGRAEMRGWVFARMEARRFVEVALTGLVREGRLRVVDTLAESAGPVYADSAFVDADAGTAAQADARPAFAQREQIDAFGRIWRLEFQSPPLAEVKRGIPGLATSLVIGIVTALLLSGIVFTLARTQARAQRLAARMSDSYRRSEQRFRSAMKYSAIGKALLDAEGRILDANAALQQIMGRSEQELVGTMLGTHFVDEQEDPLRTAEREAVGDGAYRTTRRLRRGDGDLRSVAMTFAIVPGEGREEFASLAQVEDITERLHAEARVHALNRTLEARVALRTRELSLANHELESFAYSVSHDLRAPLRSIDGFSRLLAERYVEVVDAAGRDYLGRIRAATMRMGDLIDAMLKMSRVSRGALRQENVDLSRIAMDVALELRGSDPEREVAFQIAPELKVEGDPALLRTLLENLIGNAWKFTRGRDGACIEVGRNREGEFFVRDNGAGFAPEYADKLFRPFQRLHTEEQYAGHGIGLASVKRIVERHGGSIRVEGSTGRGATFFFRLPPPEADSEEA